MVGMGDGGGSGAGVSDVFLNVSVSQTIEIMSS